MSEVKQSAPANGKAPPTLTREQVRDLLAVRLYEVCAIPVDLITEVASIERELQMESVQLVDLQVTLEQELDITIDLIDVLDLNSFGLIVDYLHELVKRNR